MSLARIFLLNEQFESALSGPEQTFEPPEEFSHHLRDVLRVSHGDKVVVVDRVTRLERLCQVHSLKPFILQIVSLLPERPKSAESTLLIALCKGDKNELITDWATELGISRIIHFQGDHSVSILRNEDTIRKKNARFTAIAESAARQSQRNYIPEISITRNLREALSLLIPAQRFVCSLSSGAAPLGAVTINPARAIQFCVGPEGDLSQAEEAVLGDNGFLSVSLGELVLRSELAVVTAIAAMMRAP